MNLEVVQPLTAKLLSGQKLGLDGDHQYVNAGLAVSLATTWLQKFGKLEVPSPTQMVNCCFRFCLLHSLYLGPFLICEFHSFPKFFFGLEYFARAIHPRISYSEFARTSTGRT